MINTNSLQSAVTAAKARAAYLKYLDDAADIYGRGSREYDAFKTLLDNDMQRFVEGQVRHLNEIAARYSRECSEWMGLLEVTPRVPHA